MPQQQALVLSINSIAARVGALEAQRALEQMGKAAKGATDAIDDTERTLKSAADSMKRVGQALTVGVSLPLVGLAGFAVKAAADMDSLRRALTAMTGDAGETARQMERLKVVAQAPGLGFREAVQGSVNLQAVGFAARDAERALAAFGNAIATTGGGKSELDRVIFQLTQMAATGRIVAQDLRPIIQTAPAVAKALTELFGTTSAEAISQQVDSFEEFFNLLIPKLEEMPSVAGGAKNALENLSDAAFRARAALGDQLLPAVLPLVEGLARMLENASALNPEMFRTAIAFGAAAAVLGPLTIGISSLATAVVALSAASAPLIGIFAVGGALVLGLGALVGLWTKNKLEALAMAGAVDTLTGSIQGLNKEASVLRAGRILAQIDGLSAIRDTRAAFGGDTSGLDAQIQELETALSTLAAGFSAGGVGGNPTRPPTADEIGKAVARALRDREVSILRQRGSMGLPGVPSMEMDAFRRMRVSAGALDFGRKTALSVPTPITANAGSNNVLSQFVGGLKSGVSGLLASFAPLAAAAAVLAPVFEGFREALGPALEPLMEALREVGGFLGDAIAPILELLAEPLKLLSQLFAALIEPLRLSVYLFTVALAPGLKVLGAALKVVTTVFSYLTEGIGWFLKALGEFIDRLVPDWISTVGKGLAEMGQSMIDNAQAVRDGTRASSRATKELEKFAGALSNVPNVVSIARLRHGVISGSGGGGGGSGGSGSSGGSAGGGGRHPTNPPITVNFYGDVMDPNAVAEAVGRAVDRAANRMGTTRLNAAFA